MPKLSETYGKEKAEELQEIVRKSLNKTKNDNRVVLEEYPSIVLDRDLSINSSSKEESIIEVNPSLNKEIQQESYFRQIDRLVERWQDGEIHDKEYRQEYYRLMSLTGLLDIPENKELKQRLEDNLKEF